ncbi:MAG: nitroreductase family protein [Acholeplasmatales bacterium]|nr:nitroreductase family protein [Acholeplasmatales bacterium]
MELFEAMEKRFSCRKFKNEKIKEEELNKVLEAGRLAPTACNYQPQRIFVIENPIILDKLKMATKYTFDAKTIIVICHDSTISWHRKDNVDHGIVDASIVATHMVLAATALNLGTCFVCSMNPTLIKEILGLSDSYVVDILLPIGYKDEEKTHNTRKDLSELVTRL